MKLILVQIFATLLTVATAYDVIYAVNCGGPQVKLNSGLQFERDYSSEGKVGTLSNVTIGGVSQREGSLYQTQRFGPSITYEIPVAGDGSYHLVMKFANIWEGLATIPTRLLKVTLNGDLVVVPETNVYAKAGMHQAYDRIINFTIKNGSLKFKEQMATIKGGKMSLRFDEPHGYAWISAILLLKGYDVENYMVYHTTVQLID